MRNIPIVTKNLLIINVLMFIVTIIMGGMGIDLNNVLGLHFFLADDFHLWQLISYMFMHGGFMHILMNMFMLWMFGMVVENVWGPKKFLLYYIICGVGAESVRSWRNTGRTWWRTLRPISTSFRVWARFL